MPFKVVLAILSVTVITVRYLLLRTGRQTRAQRENPERAVRYPVDWPDRAVSAPEASMRASTAVIQAIAGTAGAVLNSDLGGVRFRGVGFSNRLGRAHVVKEFVRQARAAGYVPAPHSNRQLASFASADGRVVFHLALDADKGPFTIWCSCR